VIAISSTVGRVGASAAAVRRAALTALHRERVPSAMLSIAFVGRGTIAKLNRSYLKRSGPTDVISFAMKSPANKAVVLGDVYICPEVVRVNARAQRVAGREELLRVVIHGVLHAMGHDHPDGERRTGSAMWKKQEMILAEVV
jgi:probable rRNA maturation factor